MARITSAPWPSLKRVINRYASAVQSKFQRWSTVMKNAALPSLVLFAAAASAAFAQDWPVVNGPGATHYSTLTQINRKNATKLERAWQFDSGDEFEGSEMECNPIVLDGVLYATTPKLRVIALDAATGKLLWAFDAHHGERVTAKQRNRGLTVWGDGDERRLFVGIDHYLYALSAKTGQPIPAFGKE